MKEADRRLRKTEAAIQKSFVAMVNLYGYDRLKLSDVINDADINKSTFYLHYPNLLSVSYSIEDKLVSGCLDAYNSAGENQKDRLMAVLAYVASNKKAVNAVLSVSEAHFFVKLERTFKPYFYEDTLDFPTKAGEEYTSTFLFSGVFGLVREWIVSTKKVESRQKFADAILTLISAGPTQK
jgi:AcrR family transcriptional regulator